MYLTSFSNHVILSLNYCLEFQPNFILKSLMAYSILFGSMRRSKYKCRYFNVTHLFVNVTGIRKNVTDDIKWSLRK